MRRLLPPLLMAGILGIPAIGASAQVVPPIVTTTTEPTTTTAPEVTTTTSAPEETTTTTEPEGESLIESSSLTGGSLSISVPSNASLSSGTPTDAGTISAQLGTVTVTDDRGSLNASWTATVSSTPFTTGTATPSETIGPSNVAYWSGAATSTSGIGVFTPGQLTAVQATDLDGNAIAFTVTGGAGATAAAWNPTIIVTIPESAVVGTYTGTITHSIA